MALREAVSILRSGPGALQGPASPSKLSWVPMGQFPRASLMAHSSKKDLMHGVCRFH